MTGIEWYGCITGTIGTVVSVWLSITGHIRQKQKDAEEAAEKAERIEIEIDVQRDYVVQRYMPRFLVKLSLAGKCDVGIKKVDLFHPNYCVQLSVSETDQEHSMLCKENPTVIYTIRGQSLADMERMSRDGKVKLRVYSSSAEVGLLGKPLKEETESTNLNFQSYLVALTSYYKHHGHDENAPPPDECRLRIS